MTIKRGEIYYINFPQTFDPNFRNGKNKFVVVLQEGEEYDNRDTVVVLLTTSESKVKDSDSNVTIETGTTKLDRETYILCSQPYTIEKKHFYKKSAWCAGQLNSAVLDEIDEALYIGLCMGLQNED